MDAPKIVAFLFSLQQPDATGAPEASLHCMGTRRPWRRRGLATALIGHVLAAYHRAGLAQVRLQVSASPERGRCTPGRRAWLSMLDLVAVLSTALVGIVLAPIVPALAARPVESTRGAAPPAFGTIRRQMIYPPHGASQPRLAVPIALPS